MEDGAYGTQSRQNEKIAVSNTRHERVQHISVITRQPGLIREVHQLCSRKQPEVFRGAESSRRVQDLRINTSMAVRQTSFRAN